MITFRLPRMFRKPEPVLIDGRAELEVAFQVHELLAPLAATSQGRVLQHVNDILEERNTQLAEFDRALADNDHTRAASRKMTA